MKAAVLLAMAAGLAATTLLVVANDAGAIWRSAAGLGWDGLAAVIAFHAVLIGLMGMAWWVLARGRPDAVLPRFVWGRLIRDSAAEALPLSQVGGYVFGARALALTGVSGAFAAASTVVDVTIELLAQLLYTLLGLLLLAWLRPERTFILHAFMGLAVMATLAGIFIAVQVRGAGLVERMATRLAREFLGRELGSSGAVQAEIHRLHQRRGRWFLAAAIHLTSWVLSGVETWLTLRLMGVPMALLPAVAIDALLYGMRSVAFLVPNALGVQEGALMLLGSFFGLGPEQALALSLIKRARDLTIGAPSLLMWQALEGRRAWRGGIGNLGVVRSTEPR